MKWFINPSINVMSVPFGDGATRWQVKLYTRQRGQRTVELPAHVAHTLLRARYAEMPGGLDAATLEFLRDIEVLVAEPVAPRPLYDVRLKLTDLTGEATDGEELRLDPSFAMRGNPHTGLWLEEFAPSGHVIAQYLVSPEILEGFIALRCGEGATLERRVRAALVRSGCLAHPSVIEARRLRRKAEFEQARDEYGELGRTVLRELVSNEELASLRSYCREFQARGFIDGEFTNGGRRWSYILNDPELEWLLRRTAPLVSDIAGQKFVPSYSFLAFFHEGGRLPLHRDRDGCHLSVSLAIDAAPPELFQQWPLTLHHSSRSPEPLTWAPGEGLLFDGISVKHERPALPDGGCATYLLLHYMTQTRAASDSTAPESFRPATVGR